MKKEFLFESSNCTGCTCCTSELEAAKSDKNKLLSLIAGTILLLIAGIFSLPFQIELILFLISYIIVGRDVVLKAIKNTASGQFFDENFLMSIATIGAFAIGEFSEGVAVMLFYQVGELFQDMAVDRSKKSIRALMNIRPDFANLKIGGDIIRVSPEEVHKGSVIVVNPGEKVPLDGKILTGSSSVDTSAITGESIPREVSSGSDILSGFININSPLTVEVTKEFSESTVSRILDLVQNASGRKAPAENFITKFAKVYTPAVVSIAVLIALVPPAVVPGAAFSEWIYRALIFLVVSCPCALVISIPLSFFAGIGGASGSGILVKGGNYLEALNNIDTVVFDKTGTLTKGVFKVVQVKPLCGLSEDELIEYAAYAESYSDHPAAASILMAYGKEPDKNIIETFNQIPGHGVIAKVKGQTILAGNIRLMEEYGISLDDMPHTPVGTIIHVAVDKKYAGFIVISDEIKEDSASAIKVLKQIGIRKLVMLTGDSRSAGASAAQSLGLDEVYAELLPHQKVERLEALEAEKNSDGKLVFVGDGINDAPVLARADIGIAMGGLGSDAAIEAADIVLMTDEPSKLVDAVKIAKKTRQIVLQNIIFAIVVKVVVLSLGAIGIATMWEAVFADVGVTLLAVLNAMRVISRKDQVHPFHGS